MTNDTTVPEPRKILGYSLVNHDKLDRAINGAVSKRGQLEGGVGAEASDEAVIAEYDRLGGLILKGKYKVKTGSFYDFKGRKPRAKADVLLTLTDINGNTVDIAENAEIPMEVKAAEMIKENKEAKIAKTTPKTVTKKKKADDEDEE